MKTHMKGDKGHICGECGRSFLKLSHLLSHKKVHKSDDKVGDVENGQGGEQSTATNDNSDCDYVEELDGNDGEDGDDIINEYFKPKTKVSKKEKGRFECKFCFKVMTTFVGLKIHMRRHTGADLAKCKVTNFLLCTS